MSFFDIFGMSQYKVMHYRKTIHIIFSVWIFVSGCKSPQVAQDGKTAFALKQYSKAPELLQKDFGSEKDLARKKEVANQIAESYQHYNNTNGAIDWYKKAVDLGDEDALYKLGQAQMMNEQYDEAIKSFNKYGARDVASKTLAQREIKNCQNAQDWKQSFTKTKVYNLSYLNSTQSDFSPILYKGKIVFSSARNECTGDTRDLWTGDKATDIFVSEVSPSAHPQSFSEALNTKDNEGTCTFSKDGNEIYFTRCHVIDQTDKKNLPTQNERCHIFYSKLTGGNWSEPELIKLMPDSVNVGQPALSKDGKTLFVSSDLQAGYGKHDLYYFIKTDTGWGGPFNAGPAINTTGDEMYPWLDDRNNLYYSSDGLQGMGGLDIFKAIKGKTVWKDPVNLKSPINSGADDFGLVIEKYHPANADDSILAAGYFTSARAGGKGGDDIYRYEDKWANFFVLKGKTLAKQYEKPDDPDSKMLGIQPISGVKVDLKNPTTDAVLATTTSDKNGNYTFKLESETDYKLTANKYDYFSKNETASTKGKRNQDSTFITVYRDIELDKIFKTKMVVIPNIYYDYDKATLRPESKAVLDSILSFFSDNKDLTIEIGSHTDSRGSDEYNLKLSQERAQSVVDYLIEKGVAKDRLIAKGYGETKLVNKCGNGVDCTEEEHQKNRRTTFRITGSKQPIESVEPENIPVDAKPAETVPEKK